MMLKSDQVTRERLRFGQFELAPGARALWRNGQRVKLGGRALDVLIVMTSRPGEILSREELTRTVWRGAHVDETALRVAMSALRKALGGDEEHYITTVPGRGYCFVSEVQTSTTQASAKPPDKILNPQPLPAQIARVVGRDEVIGDLAAEAGRRRLITLVGAGGVGKTTVASVLAEYLRTTFDAVAFVDLAPIEDAAQVWAALTTALGLNVRGHDLADEIANAIHTSRVLVVLDNCEHLIDASAALVENLLGRAPALTILATSREALRAKGEWVHRLAALDVPPDRQNISAEEARRYPAVELFEDRAALALGGYELSNKDARIVTAICRRLDGIALAIELAAGRLATLGMQGLAESLEDCFRVLIHGRRTALPRHQTLRATLDWSYHLLSQDEQIALNRLSVFKGDFTAGDAGAIAGRNTSDADFGDRLASLLDKSLLVARVDREMPRYRLLETTRSYAHEKLFLSGEANLIRRNHAEYLRTMFKKADSEWDVRPTADWLREYSTQLGNLRAALDWSFSWEGDAGIGVELTADAAPLWFHYSLLDEGLARVEHAISWLRTQPNPERRILMRLYAVLGWPQMRAISGLPHGAAAWNETLELAISLDDTDYQLRALWALWVDRGNRGAAREALDLAERFAALAVSTANPADKAVAQRLRGHSLHFIGRLAESRQCTEHMLQHYVAPAQRSHLVRFQYDQKLMAQITLARTLWLLGHTDDAVALVDHMLDDALKLDHVPSLAHVLSDAACFVALWTGNLDLAERYIGMLRAYTMLNSLDVWRTYADAFEGELLIRQHRPAEGIALLKTAMRSLQDGGFVLYNSIFAAVLAEGQLACGAYDDAEASVLEALTQCEASGEAWCVPELMRIQAQVSKACGSGSAAAQQLSAALELADAQGALAWKRNLRTDLAQIG
jgi:predicted ATPase/DNA-binding winged helix-turn-helix (wHTH) protein